MAKPKRALAPVFTLVPALPKPKKAKDARSEACFHELVKLLEQAHTGALIGIAFVAMCGDDKGGYYVNTIGEAESCPTYARGCVAALDDHLKDMVRGR